MNKFFTLLGLIIFSGLYAQEKEALGSDSKKVDVPNGISFITEGNTPRVNITEKDGNVGIGTVSPQSKLDVNGQIIASQLPLLVGSNVESSKDIRFASFYDTSMGNDSRKSINFGKTPTLNNSAELFYKHVSDGDPLNSLSLGFWGSMDILTVNGQRRVGINAARPVAELDVNGSISVGGNNKIGFNIWNTFNYRDQNVAQYGLTRVGNEVVLSGWEKLGFASASRVVMTSDGEGLDINGNLFVNENIISGGSNSWIIHTPDDDRTNFIIAPRKADGSDWNWSKSLNIEGTTGDVVINGGLFSNGRVLASNMHISETPTADFVFANDYGLRSLEETEKFIKENKHLPEIASAKEMEKEGVNVGAFQIQLLQKIEELTLYSIEQNKKIEEQAKDLALLKQKLDTLLTKD